MGNPHPAIPAIWSSPKEKEEGAPERDPRVSREEAPSHCHPQGGRPDGHAYADLTLRAHEPGAIPCPRGAASGRR